ncbi:hypothetical protein F4604DRAFT_1692699 [Suillus subluteus]|nr:hypothetical protein F4604DRAFT_1692699 [Suillus subluteus]
MPHRYPLLIRQIPQYTDHPSTANIATQIATSHGGLGHSGSPTNSIQLPLVNETIRVQEGRQMLPGDNFMRINVFLPLVLCALITTFDTPGVAPFPAFGSSPWPYPITYAIHVGDLVGFTVVRALVDMCCALVFVVKFEPASGVMVGVVIGSYIWYFGGEEYEAQRHTEAIGEYRIFERRVVLSLNLLNLVQTLIITSGLLVGSLTSSAFREGSVRSRLVTLLATTWYLFKDSDGAYFYPLALHTILLPISDALEANNGEATDAFRLRTNSIYNFRQDLETLCRVRFEHDGFTITALGVRKVPLDRVNMYTLFWRAVKTT